MKIIQEPATDLAQKLPYRYDTGHTRDEAVRANMDGTFTAYRPKGCVGSYEIGTYPTLAQALDALRAEGHEIEGDAPAKSAPRKVYRTARETGPIYVHGSPDSDDEAVWRFMDGTYEAFRDVGAAGITSLGTFPTLAEAAEALRAADYEIAGDCPNAAPDRVEVHVVRIAGGGAQAYLDRKEADKAVRALGIAGRYADVITVGLNVPTLEAPRPISIELDLYVGT